MNRTALRDGGTLSAIPGTRFPVSLVSIPVLDISCQSDIASHLLQVSSWVSASATRPSASANPRPPSGRLAGQSDRSAGRELVTFAEAFARRADDRTLRGPGVLP